MNTYNKLQATDRIATRMHALSIKLENDEITLTKFRVEQSMLDDELYKLNESGV